MLSIGFKTNELPAVALDAKIDDLTTIDALIKSPASD
jgi:hypothetical protein